MPTFEADFIDRAEYDPDTGIMTLWFAASDRVIDYRNVPTRVFEGLCKSKSKQTYFDNFIKNLFSSQPHWSV